MFSITKSLLLELSKDVKDSPDVSLRICFLLEANICGSKTSLGVLPFMDTIGPCCTLTRHNIILFVSEVEVYG